jgi:FixJ family two-component response regulator
VSRGGAAKPKARVPTVFVVDDDDAVRDSLALLLESVGQESKAFGNATDFLAVYDPDQPGCLILDIRMPGMSGLELQERLNALGAILPTIFITGHGDVPLAVKAMRGGAIDFLQKPYSEQELLDRVNQAIAADGERRRELADRLEIAARFERLTPREREVLDLILDGQRNKNAASALGVSQRTIEIHRARVMEKTGASSFAHLMKMAMIVRGGAEE